MSNMFVWAKFNKDISDWDVRKVRNMDMMFAYSEFKGDISKWDVSGVANHISMFLDCPLKEMPEKQPKFEK